MKAILNRIASMLGYIPRPAPSSVGSIEIDIDSASLDTTIAKLERLTIAAERAEAAITAALEASAGEFITAELIGDDAQALILAELRHATTLLEVLGKQGDRAAQVERYQPPYAGERITSPVSDSKILSSGPLPP